MFFSVMMLKWVKELSWKYFNKFLIIDLVGDLDEKLVDGIKNLVI